MKTTKVPVPGERESHEAKWKAPELEFLTTTGPSHNDASTAKKVRTHAMRDYIWKMKSSDSEKVQSASIPSFEMQSPAGYRGKFKLEREKRKAKSAALSRHNGIGFGPKGRRRTAGDIRAFSIIEPIRGNLSFGLRLDPFDSLAITQPGDCVLSHYHSAYSMNSIAINPNGDFFSQARSDSALFHSVLFLVALHHDLLSGNNDSSQSLYHGGKAFQIINERLGAAEAFSDMTIAAVAILANKENLSGKYELSSMHFRALKHMVRVRGGVSSFKGVFLRIITWADFCFSNIWSLPPAFPRQQLEFYTKTIPLNQDVLNPETSFGPNSPLTNIFQTLRILSLELDPEHVLSTNRQNASNMIYNIEYSILSLNAPGHDSFEMQPIAIAARIFLHLVIRQIPLISQAVGRMATRLENSLQGSLEMWRKASDEAEEWLLWALFVGFVASTELELRAWYVEELRLLLEILGITQVEEMQATLEKVLWRRDFFAEQCEAAWEVIMSSGR